MSEREQVIQKINAMPDFKVSYILAYINWLENENDVPNKATLEAFEEIERMKQTGSGQHFSGSSEDYLTKLLED